MYVIIASTQSNEQDTELQYGGPHRCQAIILVEVLMCLDERCLLVFHKQKCFPSAIATFVQDLSAVDILMCVHAVNLAVK